MNRITRTLTTTACLGLLAMTGTACGDEADADGPTTTAEDTADHSAGHDDVGVTIDGVDYGFENVPASVPAGTRLGFRNTSGNELHELVAFRLDTDVPLGELLTQPPAELEAVLGAPVTVILQSPDAPEPIMAVGDGTLTEPGRYVLMCFIPIGADPAEYLAAAAAAGGGKPEGVAGGPPHFTAGMVAELTVE
jgi:plastocyanin